MMYGKRREIKKVNYYVGPLVRHKHTFIKGVMKSHEVGCSNPDTWYKKSDSIDSY